MTSRAEIPSERSSAESASRATRGDSGDSDDLLDHEYDGIREYDNPLPRWWVSVFWASFVFSLGYAFHYHLSGNGISAVSSYEQEERIARAEKSKRALAEAPSENALAILTQDSELMESAQLEYEKRCSPCHAAEGQGLIGPNLTDDYWLNGQGTLMDIYAVVSRGVPAKGMPAWQDQLSAGDLRKLTALIGTLRGKSLSGKGPEGHLVKVPESNQ